MSGVTDEHVPDHVLALARDLLHSSDPPRSRDAMFRRLLAAQREEVDGHDRATWAAAATARVWPAGVP